MKTLVPLADGVEEMEAVIILDVLRRAKWDVTAAALAGCDVTGSRGVRLKADAAWADLDPADFDLIVLPGGAAGVEAFLAFPPLLDALRDFAAAGKPLAALCAAPLALQAAGVLDGREATAHPSVLDRLTRARRRNDRVVKDGAIITSRGPGTAFEFALALVRYFDSPTKAVDLARAMFVSLTDVPPT
jgi:4-methyl-5(b-hydroxyethyl)-thiazole monophosphate biosynthesis